MRPRLLVAGLTALIPLAGSHAAIEFVEVTSDAGISYVGESWGAAWGDYNGDGLPDLWVPNHGNFPSLYVNQGDGSFLDIAPDVIAEVATDKHGAAWTDFDGDGDQDLVQLVAGGSQDQPNSLFENLGGAFADVAPLVGLDLPEGRGRTPLWFDADRDGRVDLLINSSGPISSIMRQEVQGFTDFTSQTGLDNSVTLQFATLSDLTLDGNSDLLIRVDGKFPGLTYDLGSVPFVDFSESFPANKVMMDAVVADLTGDLLPDMYIVHAETVHEVLQVDEHLLEAHLDIGGGEELGFDLSANGDLDFLFEPDWRLAGNSVDILRGEGATVMPDYAFTAGAADPDNWGFPDYSPGVDKGIFIGFDPASGVWKLRLSNFSVPTNIVVESEAVITDLDVVGFDPATPPRNDVLLVHDGASFADASDAAGIGAPSWGISVVAQDFDNDMDLDIYILATGNTRNRENILYENLGGGTFSAVAAAGGAGGTDQGHGDAIAAADFDVDGYVDLFLTNGKSKEPFDQDGPVQLFRNTGAGNSWLEIDLRGVQSTPDAHGAIVFVGAGGVVQMREQTGGMHFHAQNHQRLHFGLADNASADTLEIRWPSGVIQHLGPIDANQVLTIVEPLDSDRDTVQDTADNCVQQANPAQDDADGDGFGNACDADLNNDCVVDFLDLSEFKSLVFSTDPLADFDGDGDVDFDDLVIMKQAFFAAPGPSGSAGICTRQAARSASRRELR